MAIKKLRIKCNKLVKNSTDPTKLRFRGYSGGPVNLSDHGLRHPVYYDLETMTVGNQKIPLMYNHRTEIGHTTKVEKTDKDLTGTAILSVQNKAMERVKNATAAEFPYQASMGLNADTAKVFFLKKGTLNVNNRDVAGPCYIMKDTNLQEMTVCPLGRDSDTSVQVFNSKELSTINNNLIGEPVRKKRTPTKVVPAPRPQKKVVRNAPEADEVLSGLTGEELADILELNSEHPTHAKLIANGVRRGYSMRQIKNKIKLVDLENGMFKPPVLGKDDADLLQARFIAGICNEPETTLEKHFGKKVRDNVLAQPQIELREILVNASHRYGGRFTGFSDVENMIDFLAKASRGKINNVGFSSFDFPEFFKKSAEIVLEESWKIENRTFAQEMCYETSNENFFPTERYRPRGGEMWEGLTDDGRIKHTQFGKSTRYLTTLDTKAQLLVLDRPTLINNNMDVIKEMFALMVEGALILPDYKLINRMWQPNGTFFVSSTNDFTLALTRANLSTVYAAARTYAIEKGKVNWLNSHQEKWVLVHGPNLAETAFDLLQKQIVSNTTANTIQGSKNFWEGKILPREMPNLGNTSINTNAQSDAWFLWPTAPRFAPFTLTYLRGQKKPTIRSVEVDADILGVAMQGFWDLEVNDRESAAIFRSRPTGSVTANGAALV